MSWKKRILVTILGIPLACILAWTVASQIALASLPVDDGPGHDGSSTESPIIIHASDEPGGVLVETVWLSIHRPKHVIVTQGVIPGSGQAYDVYELESPDGERSTLYFDITEWYGSGSW